MCYLMGKLTPGRYDLLLGEIGGCEFFIGQSHHETIKQAQLIIDVIKSNGDTFSREGPEGVGFITRSRLCTVEESQTMTPAQALITQTHSSPANAADSAH